MSMNLTARDVNGNMINIYQTPTHITYYCLGIHAHHDEPVTWKQTKRRYLEWVDNNLTQNNNFHADYINSFDFIEFSYI